MGIQKKMFLWLAVVMFPIAAAGTFAVQAIDARLSERIEADLANARRLEVARIEDALEGYKRDAESLAAGPHVREFVGELNAYRNNELPSQKIIGGYDGFTAIDPNAEHPLAELAMRLRQKAVLVDSEVVELQLIDLSGNVLGTTADYSWVPTESSIIARSFAHASPVIGNAFSNTKGRHRLGVVAPIFDPEGRPVGAVMLETRLGPIVNLVIKHEGFGDTSEAHIAQPTSNGDAEFITLLRFEREAAFNKVIPKSRNLPINQALRATDGAVLRALDYRGTESILAIETIQPVGWGLVIKIDVDEAFAPVAEIRRLVWWAGGMTLAVIFFSWGLFLQPVASRLRRAATAAEHVSSVRERVARGEFLTPIGDDAYDEIGEMSRSIDRLAVDLEADIRMRAAAEDRLRYQAMHDELTGLYNRKHANEIISELNKDPNARVAILFLDLDGFKGVNDMYGHAAGDEVLCAVANRLSAVVGEDATLARWGGDEFVVILPDADDGAARKMASHIRTIFTAPLESSDGKHTLGCSIGMATASEQDSISKVLAEADALMYAEKQTRRSERSVVNTAVKTVEAALSEHRVEVWFQPLVSTMQQGGQQLIGAEALVRIRAAGGGIITPNDFIWDIQSHSVAGKLDRFILAESLAALAAWRANGRVSMDFRLAVNLSEESLQDVELADEISWLLKQFRLPAHCLVLELSERAARIDDNVLLGLRDLGVVIALDDMGVEHSNIDRLITIQPHIAKLDRRWLQDPEGMEGQHTQNVLPKLIDICNDLGARIVGEGVQSTEQLRLLNNLGVDQCQGYLFDAPLTHELFLSRWGRRQLDANLGDVMGAVDEGLYLQAG